VACSGKIKVMGSEVFTEVSMKITDFLDTTPCSLNDTYNRVPNIRYVTLSYTAIRRAVSNKSNFTNGDSFCWPTLLECIHYTTWRWSFKGRNMLQWRIVLIKWHFNNVWLHFVFEFPCIISLYYVKNQRDVTLAVFFISNCKITLHILDAFCAHHQEY
jgi:hypothetical protein